MGDEKILDMNKKLDEHQIVLSSFKENEDNLLELIKQLKKKLEQPVHNENKSNDNLSNENNLEENKSNDNLSNENNLEESKNNNNLSNENNLEENKSNDNLSNENNLEE